MGKPTKAKLAQFTKNHELLFCFFIQFFLFIVYFVPMNFPPLRFFFLLFVDFLFSKTGENFLMRK